MTLRFASHEALEAIDPPPPPPLHTGGASQALDALGPLPLPCVPRLWDVDPAGKAAPPVPHGSHGVWVLPSRAARRGCPRALAVVRRLGGIRGVPPPPIPPQTPFGHLQAPTNCSSAPRICPSPAFPTALSRGLLDPSAPQYGGLGVRLSEFEGVETTKSGGGKTAGHKAALHTAGRRAPTGHKTRHKGTMRCEHCSNHQMQRTPSEPSANTPPPSTRCPRTPQGRGLRPALREVPATGVATGP